MLAFQSSIAGVTTRFSSATCASLKLMAVIRGSASAFFFKARSTDSRAVLRDDRLEVPRQRLPFGAVHHHHQAGAANLASTTTLI
jgi:hypothetical protein